MQVPLALVVVLLLPGLICAGCAFNNGQAEKASEKEIVLGSYHPESSEGELVGKTWCGDRYLISIEEADGEVSDYLVSQSNYIERLENSPAGSWVKISYFDHEEEAIPAVYSLELLG